MLDEKLLLEIIATLEELVERQKREIALLYQKIDTLQHDFGNRLVLEDCNVGIGE